MSGTDTAGFAVREPAAPAPLAPRLAETGAHRVVPDVFARVREMLVVLDDLRAEPILKQVPGAAVALVEPLGMDAVDPVEGPRDRLHRALYDRVNVVGHEAIRMRLQGMLRNQAPEEHEEKPVVVLVAEDQAPVDAADRDVEDPERREHPPGQTSHPRILS